MKTISLFLIFLLSLKSYSQDTPKRTVNMKSIKTCVTFAGVSLIAGSVVNVIRTYKTAPVSTNYSTSELYNKDLDKYNQKQKDLQRVSSFFYGVSGASLITLCFNF